MNGEKKIIESFLNELWNDKCVDSSSGLYDPFADQLVIDSPVGKTLGLKNLVGINTGWHAGFPDMKVKSIEVEIYGNLVIASWWSEATHLDEFKGYAPTGKKVLYPGETRFLFSEGKITRYACKIDMLHLYTQLGFSLRLDEYEGQSQMLKDRSLLIGALRRGAGGRLSLREVEVLSLCLCGFSAKQAGLILSISSRTIESHKSRALGELFFSSLDQCRDSALEDGTLALWQDLGKLISSDYAKRKKNISRCMRR